MTDSIIQDVVNTIHLYKIYKYSKIDVRKKNLFFDTIIIIVGTSRRQIYSTAIKIKQIIKNKYNIIPCIEGINGSNWIVINIYSISIHLLLKKEQEKYDLENLWNYGY